MIDGKAAEPTSKGSNFFCLARNLLSSIGLICAVYITFRIIGKMVGARVGGQFGNSGRQTKRWMGVALLPQAGVAIGMALVASNFIPEYRQTLPDYFISQSLFQK